jgi:hypothetical protein
VLAALQNALVALALDEARLRRFAAAPEEALAAFELDPPARALLLGIPLSDLRRFADGLRHKRWDDLREVVPLSAGVVSRLGERYRRWLAAHPPRAADDVLAPGVAEGLRALPALAAELRDDPGEAPWAADLLAFEVLGAAARGDGAVRGMRSAYAVHAIASELRAGLVPVDPPCLPHEYRFEAAGVRHRRPT